MLTCFKDKNILIAHISVSMKKAQILFRQPLITHRHLDDTTVLLE